MKKKFLGVKAFAGAHSRFLLLHENRILKTYLKTLQSVLVIKKDIVFFMVKYSYKSMLKPEKGIRALWAVF